MPKLESVEAVLVRCNLVKNDYQHASKVLFTFVQGINILPHSLTMMNTINTCCKNCLKKSSSKNLQKQQEI